MTPLEMLAAASASFVGTHFLLSHPLRQPLVNALGNLGFAIVYYLVAFATFGWIIYAYYTAPAGEALWEVGDALWAVVTVVMLLAAVVLMGSLIGNPALPTYGADRAGPPEARGVFAISRHPLMWSFALWGVCHIAVYPQPKNIIVASAVIFLALVGSALQDHKKERLQPEKWRAWEARTSYWPFLAVAQGRARLSGLGLHAWAGGVVVWLVASWAHLPLAGWPAGIWRWIH